MEQQEGEDDMEGEASDDPSSDDGKVNFSQATAQPFNGQPGGKERNGANEIPRDAVRGSDLSPDDILLGRGVPMQRHPGNIRMHHLINSYRHQYRKASRSEKALMIQEVLQKLKEGGVRFRKRADNEDLWVEVSDQVAYDKISHALRGRGSERRAPPRESEVHLAGTLLSSPERLQHEGKCDIQHEVSMDGTSSAVAGKQPLRPGPGPLQMISESSSQNRGDHNAAANAINLSRLLLNSGNGTSRPDITLLSQRGEIQPSSLLTSGRSLAVTANMTSPIGAANLSGAPRLQDGSLGISEGIGRPPDILQALATLRATSAGSSSSGQLIQQMLLQQTQDQQQILTPVVGAILGSIHGIKPSSNTLEQQLRQLSFGTTMNNPLALNSGTANLLNSLRGISNQDTNNALIQSLLQERQQRTREPSLLDTLARANNLNMASGVMPSSGLGFGRTQLGLNMALDHNLGQSQQHIVSQNARDMRGLQAPAQRLSDDLLISLLLRHNMSQEPPNQDQTRR